MKYCLVTTVIGKWSQEHRRLTQDPIPCSDNLAKLSSRIDVHKPSSRMSTRTYPQHQPLGSSLTIPLHEQEETSDRHAWPVSSSRCCANR